MNVFMMKRARARREARWDATGEGSRGGHIIGHTSSGKPIYSTHGHAAHKEFTPAEHNTAGAMHAHIMRTVSNSFGLSASGQSGYSEKQKKAKNVASHHFQQAKKHAKSAGLESWGLLPDSHGGKLKPFTSEDAVKG